MCVCVCVCVCVVCVCVTHPAVRLGLRELEPLIRLEQVAGRVEQQPAGGARDREGRRRRREVGAAGQRRVLSHCDVRGTQRQIITRFIKSKGQKKARKSFWQIWIRFWIAGPGPELGP